MKRIRWAAIITVGYLVGSAFFLTPSEWVRSAFWYFAALFMACAGDLFKWLMSDKKTPVMGVQEEPRKEAYSLKEILANSKKSPLSK